MLYTSERGGRDSAIWETSRRAMFRTHLRISAILAIMRAEESLCPEIVSGLGGRRGAAVACLSDRKCAVLLGVLVLLMVGIPSCATSPTAPSIEENAMPVPDTPFALRAGDSVEVKFLYHPELNAAQPVRPDGRISLQLVDEVEVAGLSPEEVRQQLLALYRVKLRDPEITVVVRAEERYVYVGGEVNIPSGQFPIRVPLVGSLTPLEAIMQAGGLKNRSAKVSNVLIIRRFEGEQYARTLDLRNALEGAETVPFFLEPNDVVFVPRTRIDRADQWVDQYMNRLVPDWIAVNLGYTYTQTETVGRRSTITASPSGVSVSRTE